MKVYPAGVFSYIASSLHTDSVLWRCGHGTCVCLSGRNLSHITHLRVTLSCIDLVTCCVCMPVPLWCNSYFFFVHHVWPGDKITSSAATMRHTLQFLWWSLGRLQENSKWKLLLRTERYAKKEKSWFESQEAIVFFVFNFHFNKYKNGDFCWFACSIKFRPIVQDQDDQPTFCNFLQNSNHRGYGRIILHFISRDFLEGSA